MHDIYRDGFLEGMRYSGHLLSDVENEDLTLSNYLENVINKTYLLKYKGVERSKKLHQFVSKLILDCDNLYDENQKLKELLYGQETQEKN